MQTDGQTVGQHFGSTTGTKAWAHGLPVDWLECGAPSDDAAPSATANTADRWRG